jgi:hypothetical protein
MIDVPSVRIWCGSVVSVRAAECLPLSALTLDDHIHGELNLQIGGRLVPHLGLFDPSDVCFNTWLQELSAAARILGSSADARHVFDEGEQGQPAFVFERVGDRAYFSINDSEISEGRADLEWQRVEFSPGDFLDAHVRFRDSLFALIRAAALQVAEEWIRQHSAE